LGNDEQLQRAAKISTFLLIIQRLSTVQALRAAQAA